MRKVNYFFTKMNLFYVFLILVTSLTIVGYAMFRVIQFALSVKDEQTLLSSFILSFLMSLILTAMVSVSRKINER